MFSLALPHPLQQCSHFCLSMSQRGRKRQRDEEELIATQASQAKPPASQHRRRQRDEEELIGTQASQAATQATQASQAQRSNALSAVERDLLLSNFIRFTLVQHAQRKVGLGVGARACGGTWGCAAVAGSWYRTPVSIPPGVGGGRTVILSTTKTSHVAMRGCSVVSQCRCCPPTHGTYCDKQGVP